MEYVPIVLLMKLEAEFFCSTIHYAHKTQQATYIRYSNKYVT